MKHEFDYKAELKRVEQQLAKLQSERDRIDREIAGTSHMLEALKFLATEPDFNEPASLDSEEAHADIETVGFSKKVREIMGRNREALTPVEIRDALQAEEIKATSPKHLLISVHTVIRRWREKEQVIEESTERGKAYRLPTAIEQFQKKMASAQDLVRRAKGERESDSGTE